MPALNRDGGTNRDRAAITHTIESILHGVDLHQWDAVAAAFGDRVELDYGTPETLSPRDIIARWQPLFSGLASTQHILRDVSIELGEDRARVRSRFEATHVLRAAAGGDVWTLAGRYEHELSRTAAGWKVTRMRMIPEQSTGNAGLLDEARARASARPVREPAAAPPRADYLPADPTQLLRADPNRRTPVRFKSDGVLLAGHLYRPRASAPTDRTPAIAMVGPFSSVKEQTLPHYAERLADAGYTVLTFDSRGFGESAEAAGRPRWHYDPNEIIQDYCNAVSYLLTRPDVEHDSVAVVGVCMGGGYAVSVGARDKRIKAVASVAGGYNIGGTFQQLLGIEGFAAYYRRINDLVQQEYETGQVQYVPTIAHALSADVPVAAMPNEEAYSYYARTHRDHAPTWSEKMTAASFGPYFIYNSVAHAPLVAPAPMLIVHGTHDLFLLPEYAQAAYDAAIGPKHLAWIETHNHIELYDQDPYVSRAVAELVGFLNVHLAHTSPVPR